MPSSGSIASKLVDAAARLRDEVDRLSFADPVTHVYNPLRYAWDAHETYLRKFGELSACRRSGFRSRRHRPSPLSRVTCREPGLVRVGGQATSFRQGNRGSTSLR